MANLSVIFAMKLRAERRRRTKVSPRFAIAIRYSLFPASSCYMNAEPGYGRGRTQRQRRSARLPRCRLQQCWCCGVRERALRAERRRSPEERSGQSRTAGAEQSASAPLALRFFPPGWQSHVATGNVWRGAWAARVWRRRRRRRTRTYQFAARAAGRRICSSALLGENHSSLRL